MIRKLFYGDNLQVMRESVKDESVDLIYLDPPFNSKRAYNVFFESPEGLRSDAQAVAFVDNWTWGDETNAAIAQIADQPKTKVADLCAFFLDSLGQNGLSAYLVMMAVRLLEMERALKPDGSIYLHCDPAASHYIKVLMDNVFGAANFRNEIVWKRSQPKSQTSVNFASCHDVILRYSKTQAVKFNKNFTKYDQGYLAKFYKRADESGRLYQLADLTNPNKNRPNLTYEFLGITRVWRWTKQRMMKAYEEGLIVQPASDGIPRLKRYLDEMPGMPITDWWDDIEHLHASHAEALGYPTQKPLALLKRIIQASSNPGDVLMDPFCGCGTAIEAAEGLGRQWIGIDITHLAIALIEKRIRDAFRGIPMEVIGTPKDLASACDLAARDKYQFQWWACSLVGAQPRDGKKKGPDRGVDGLIYFIDDGSAKLKKIIVSVKGGQNVDVSMIRDLRGVMEREKAEMAYFVTLAEPTKPMIAEAAASGSYAPKNGQFCPRIQILTIEGLLSGIPPKRPQDFSLGNKTFKKNPVKPTEARSNGLKF
jgi:site-specific DNA-methyltransferase (adenine-specific)